VGAAVTPAILPATKPMMPPTFELLASGVVTFVPAKTLPLFVKFVATPLEI